MFSSDQGQTSAALKLPQTRLVDRRAELSLGVLLGLVVAPGVDSDVLPLPRLARFNPHLRAAVAAAGGGRIYKCRPTRQPGFDAPNPKLLLAIPQ